MFVGEYTHTLDDKGRLTLPARMREPLGERVVVTRGFEQCLFVFPADDFEKFMASFNTVGLGGADVRGLSRYFGSKAIEDAPDKQGRINLPQQLREHAQLDGEVIVIGAFDHVELWNPTLYAQQDAELVVNVPDMSERVNEALLRMRQK